MWTMKGYLMVNVIISAVLLWNSILDWKYKKISLISVLAGIISIWMAGHIRLIHLSGAAVGILLFLCSFFTRGQIGIGDGIIFCMTGLGYGFWGNLGLLFLSFLFSAVVSAVLLFGRRVGRKTRIPFIPFVMAAHMLIQICKI